MDATLARENGDLSRAHRVVLLTSVIDPGHGYDQGQRGGWWGKGGEDHQHSEYLRFTKSIRRSSGSNIYDMVRGWLTDREPAASDSFHYCRDLCESQGEADQAWVWMLNLIAYFVAKDESWLDSIHTAKDWRQLGLSGIVDYWEVPPPLHNDTAVN